MSDRRSGQVNHGSGNVFEDLELAEPRRLLVKAKLASLIGAILSRRGLTQTEAARILGTDQPKVSALVRGELYGFSVERLLEHLSALGQDVEITIRDRASCSETGRVVMKSPSSGP